MTFIGKDGYPVETIKGRPFTNLIRILIHTSIKQTLIHPICGRCGRPGDAGCGTSPHSLNRCESHQIRGIKYIIPENRA